MPMELKLHKHRQDRQTNGKSKDKYCIFQPVFGSCTLQALVEIFIFNVFHLKKLRNGKKARNFLQHLAKNVFFLLHQNPG